MLKLTDISVDYGQIRAVNKVNFSLEKGQIGCLLGPSGCGKTSVLRAIAGFEPITSGTIEISHQLMSEYAGQVMPEKRNVGIVFQDFALFPHLSVAQNIAFGLKQGTKSEKQHRVQKVIELVELTGQESRFPHELSGGQQQRVALARAIAPKPEVLLLDEPFANLDADLRESLASQIRNIIKYEQITALMVTHDQHEAFYVADVIGVMSSGKMQQLGNAYDLYHRPVNRFIASFIGEGVFVPGTITSQNQLQTALGVLEVPTSKRIDNHSKCQILVRPDDVIHDDDSKTLAKVVNKSFRGSHIMYELNLLDRHQQRVLCLAPSHHDHHIGESIGIRLDLEHVVIFQEDKES
ncbi:ABC transporter ATP-binding protein [Aliiglaciecola sp. M165]|uniref:ABC transporter ATP-binding protein n=1 Tax=Aliiglaciecola sp. M165 TaxID=2593649 RepID=UPI00117EAC80|nr:ABC transporter ATP-binding protein [Aliiglaciecola sp. M165]TRY31020.1 ABC transporter ATP-binding protein [Aliiglaciecola sp. M165]